MDSVPDPVKGYTYNGIALPCISLDIVDYSLRSHCTCGEAGWEQVADFALDWALTPTSGDLDQA